MVQLVLKSPSAAEEAATPERSPERLIERLEASLGRMRVALAVVTGLALLPWIGVALAWERVPSFEQWRRTLPKLVDLPCEIRAQSFRALNPAGREVAFIGRGAKGGGNVTLRDDDGGKLLVAGDFDGNGGFIEVGSDDQISAHLGAGDSPAGFLILRNEKGLDLAYVGRDPRGDGRFFLNRADGTDLVTIGRGDHDENFLNLVGPKGSGGAVLVTDDQGGALDLYDSATRKILYAGPRDGGSAIVKVFAPEGPAVAAFGASGEPTLGGFFQAFNQKGEPLFYGGHDQSRGHGLLNVGNRDGGLLFAAGIDGKDQGGVLNVYDLHGQMVLRTPDWE